MSKFSFVCVVLFAVLFGLALGGGGHDHDHDTNFNEKDVIVLTDSTFDSVVNDADVILVEFYAPWCGHCKHLAPEYAKAATALKDNDPPVKLAKVDATVETALASRFGVQGYPTLKVFRKGTPTDYNGPRQADGIVKYMRGQAGPSAKPLKTEADYTKFLSFSEDVSVVGFFASGSPSVFTDVADSLREDYRFGVVTDADLVKKFNNGKDGVVVFRPAAWKGEEPSVSYSGDLSSKDDITSFVHTASVPLAGEYSAATQKRYDLSPLPRVTLYTAVNQKRDPSGFKYYANRLRAAAKEFIGKLHFVLSDKASSREYSELGFPADSKHGLAAVNTEGHRFRAPDGEFSVESVKQFAADLVAGKLTRHVKSEPEPTDNSGPVKIVTGKNFDELVTNSDKDVFIEFYAPWCGHCKSLAPKWEELGKKFAANSDSVTIAKIDATANDYSKKFEVQGFPTIYLLKANDKNKPVQYQGGREVKDMEKWLKSNMSRKLKAEL